MWTDPARRGAVACAASTLMLVALSPLAASASPSPPPAEVTVGDRVTSFSYWAPSDFAGDLNLRFEFDWGPDNPCRILFGLSGTPSDAPLWGLVASDRGEAYGFYPDHALRVHAAGAAVDPSVTVEDDNWGFGIFTFDTRSGYEWFTVAGVGLARWVSSEGGVFENLFFDVDCEAPFLVAGIAGGAGMVSVSEAAGGGVGAAFRSPVSEATAAVADGFQVELADPVVGLVVRVFAGDGTGLAEPVSAGLLTVRTPEGTTNEPLADGAHVAYFGEGGTYGVTATWLGAATSTTFFGAAFGLTPVDALTDLAAWTG